ncbi:uncharacterized protein [Triticum aestivum]|uniref:uncharacterized protein isoform X5 n=1 Tax=Triticum aestivum TaxID=4565 RepID=UPI001D02EA6A|nr:uncharacterized protein LOC123121868 isoform X5 [Triticum aestivum]
MCYPFMCKAGRLHHQWVSDMKSSTLLCQCCVMLEHAINLCRTRTPHELRPLPHNRHRVLYGSIQSRCSTNFTGTPTAGAPPEVVFNWRQISVIVMHGRRARPYCKHIDPLMDLSFHSPTTQFLGDEDRSVAHADPSAWRSSMILRLVTGLQSKQHSRPQNSHDTADEVRIVAIQENSRKEIERVVCHRARSLPSIGMRVLALGSPNCVCTAGDHALEHRIQPTHKLKRRIFEQSVLHQR